MIIVSIIHLNCFFLLVASWYLIQLMDASSNTNAVLDDNFISNLGRTFSESLHIEDAQESVNASGENDICNVDEEKLCGAIKEQETQVNMMCLKKYASFPICNTMLPSSSSEKGADTSVTESLSEHSAHQTYSRSISLPVSAQFYRSRMLVMSECLVCK